MVDELRRMGHDVLTALEAGQANRGIPDPDVLAFAIGVGRAVLTLNRRHFARLHRQVNFHCGIVVCTPRSRRCGTRAADSSGRYCGDPTREQARADREAVGALTYCGIPEGRGFITASLAIALSGAAQRGQGKSLSNSPCPLCFLRRALKKTGVNAHFP